MQSNTTVCFYYHTHGVLADKQAVWYHTRLMVQEQVGYAWDKGAWDKDASR